jgi:hypothetical protein
MSDKKKAPTGDQIRVGNISGSSGVAIGRGAKASVTYGSSADSEDLQKLFAAIYTNIESRPEERDIEKEEIVQVVQNIEKETVKGEEANPGKVERWLGYLSNMAPDILDVTLAALTNPAAGIATAIRKIAEKARVETGRA